MEELAKKTWPEVAELVVGDTVVFVPIGSTEPHGPHLPLDTDVVIARAQAERAAVSLEARGVRTLLLPAVSYGVTYFTEGFAGTLSLRPGTLWALLEDLVVALEQEGFRRIVFCNGHLEPAHIKIVRGVAADHAEDGANKARVVFPDNTRRRWAQTLGDEFAGGDCHAGRYETSIVMAADPDSVREGQRKELPDVKIELIEKMQAGVSSFREAGADRAYCGAPSEASRAEGEELIERLAEMVLTSIEEAWPELGA